MLFLYLLQRTNGGIVMVNFFADYILCKNEGRNATLADVAGKFVVFWVVFVFAEPITFYTDQNMHYACMPRHIFVSYDFCIISSQTECHYNLHFGKCIQSDPGFSDPIQDLSVHNVSIMLLAEINYHFYYRSHWSHQERVWDWACWTGKWLWWSSKVRNHSDIYSNSL